MAANPASARDVGVSFVRTYSKTLEQDPSSLALFFKADSVYSYSEVDGEAEIEVGVENIKARIQASGFHQGGVVAFHSVDCLDTVGQAVLVLCSGEHTKAGVTRPFAQVFLLAPQTPTGYYLRNYVVRMLRPNAPAGQKGEKKPREKKTEEKKEAPKKEEPKKDEAAKPASPAPSAPAPAPAHAASATAAAHAPAPSTAPAPAAAPAAPAAAKPAPAAAPASSAAAAPAVAAPKGGKVSYASKLATPAKEPAPAPAAPAQASGTTAPATGAAGAPAAAKPPAPKAAPKAGAAPKGKGPAAGAANGHRPNSPALRSASPSSLYVRNLPFEGDFMGTLRAELSRHGSIKEITMGQGFAFLEYDSPDAAEKCLKAYEQQGFQIQGRDVTVERRNPSKASSAAASAKKDARRGPPRQPKAEAGKA